VKETYSIYVEYHKKQTYWNNMEPEGTSQQESGVFQSFPEMENVGIWSFQKMNINK